MKKILTILVFLLLQYLSFGQNNQISTDTLGENHYLVYSILSHVQSAQNLPQVSNNSSLIVPNDTIKNYIVHYVPNQAYYSYFSIIVHDTSNHIKKIMVLPLIYEQNSMHKLKVDKDRWTITVQANPVDGSAPAPWVVSSNNFGTTWEFKKL